MLRTALGLRHSDNGTRTMAFGMRRLLLSGLLVSTCLPMASASGQELSADLTSEALRSGYDNSASILDVADGGAPLDGSYQAPDGSNSSLRSAQKEQGAGRRTAQDIGPYDPLGIRLGDFLLYPSLTLWGEMTDNVDGTVVGQEGRTVTPEFEARIESDWARHSLAISGSAGITAYGEPDRHPETDQALSGELRLDLANDTQLTLDGSFSRSQEDSSVELTATGQSATYETNMSAGATLDQRAGLLDLQLRGSVGALRYQDEESRDYDTYRIGARVGLPVTDQIMPFVDVELAQRRYVTVNNRQNGDSLRGAIGVEVANREKLSGEVSVGFISWDPELSGQEGDVTAFADASVVWSPDALWTIRGGLDTELTSTATAARSVATHRVSLSADYAMLRNLTFTASGDVSRETYNGLSRRDWVLDAALKATYSFNRNVQVIASVERSQRESNWVGEDTATSTVRVGLKLQH